jgi:hypothetical protein
MAMRHPTLVILAAGQSAVFGGRKQQTSVGPDGEFLYDYTVYDALSCGFERVVFVVRPDNERDVKNAFEDRFGASVPVTYVRQFRPLGTGHAVASLGGLVDAPFGLANASDRYGREAMRSLADKLRQLAESPAAGAPIRGCLVSYRLGDTLSDSGGVSRAVFRPEVDRSPEADSPPVAEPAPTGWRKLKRVRQQHTAEHAAGEGFKPAGFDEVLDIRMTTSGEIAGRYPGGTEITLSPDDRVSMNLWGFDPGIVEALAAGYNQWTYGLEPGQIDEYRLSSAMDRLLGNRLVDLEMLAAPDGAWMGLFHRADVGPVRDAVAAAIERGDYPASLKQAIRGQ